MADTHTAASCSRANVVTAITAASAGDTVSIPACTLTAWSSAINVDKAITIQGAGMDATNIRDYGFAFSGDLTGWRVTGITFSGNWTNNMLIDTGAGEHPTYLGAKDFRIDHCRFTKTPYSTGATIYVKGYAYGVIDNNYFTDCLNEIISYGGDSLPSLSRSTDLGGYTNGTIFIEDNIFELTVAPSVQFGDTNYAAENLFDSNGAARITFRYNTVKDHSTIRWGDCLEVHGLESENVSHNTRGTVSLEVYENTFESNYSQSMPQLMKLRGLSYGGVMYNNTRTGAGTSFVNVELANLRSQTSDPTGSLVKSAVNEAGYSNFAHATDGAYICEHCVSHTGLVADQVNNWYYWNNTDGFGTPYVRDSGYTTSDIVLNTHYFLSAKTGYTPYTYPHPLRAINDITPPDVTAFTFPSTSSSLTVPITTFTATDDTAVTGYMLTESASAPASGDPGWSGSAPTEYVFTTEGPKTLYAWAKDAAGNVSTSLNDSVTVTLPTYTIGGSLSGLTGTVVLQNNGGNDLSRSANGSFTFSTSLYNGSAYDVTVLTKPSGQTCTVSNHSGTVSSADITNVSVSCSDDPTYTIGVTISGLDETVVLQNNSGDDLSRSANGSFTFATALYDNVNYNVTVFSQPSGQTCTVTNGSGTVSGSNVTNVSISCSDNSDITPPTVTAFTIPLTSSSLTVPVTTFTAMDDTGVTGYMLTESASAPASGDPEWSGSVPTEYVFTTEGAKTLYAWAKDAAGNVSTSLNDSVTITLPTYTIGGTISGLTGTVILQNNSGDDLSRSANGSFAFATALDDGASYAVTVLTHPSGQTCGVMNGSGTVSGANVTNILVSCLDNPSDSTPPVRSNRSPSGELSKGTTSKTLSLSTDENATCRFSPTSGTDYDSMTHSFTGSGTTSHTYSLSGLRNGTDYSYFARCQDANLNANTNDYAISFSVKSSSSHKNEKPKPKRKLSISPKKASRGEVLTESGKRFSKSSYVALYFSRYGGGYYSPKIVKTDAKGRFSLTYRIPYYRPSGTYSWYAVDLKNGKKSKTVYYNVK